MQSQASIKPGPGRPTLFSEELAEAICVRIMMGESLRSICRVEEMPALSTICSWLANPEKYPGFLAQYHTARSIQTELFIDDIISIADDASDDYTDSGKGPRPNPVNLHRAKLRIDARKWAVGRMASKSRNSYTAVAQIENKPPIADIILKETTEAEIPASIPDIPEFIEEEQAPPGAPNPQPSPVPVSQPPVIQDSPPPLDMWQDLRRAYNAEALRFKNRY